MSVNEGRVANTYTFDLTWIACPTQVEGVLDDGRNYYFRYRHGYWTLSVSEQPGGDAVRMDAPLVAADALGDSLDGYMEEDEVRVILSRYFGTEVEKR